MDNSKYIELSRLIVESLEGVISTARESELRNLISTDNNAMKYYLEFLTLRTDLHYSNDLSINEAHREFLDMGCFDSELWQALAENEEFAVAVEVENPIEESVEPRLGLMKVEKPKRKISRLSVYTLILSAAAVLLFMIMVLISPVRPIVATLTDSINAEWISEDEIPVEGEVLREGVLTLVKGLAEITFDDGAVVVVEGPAIIELESPKAMFVTSGKISAVVSEYATGFTVNTLSASIVDLGTEFGVSVEGDGSCSLHMFKGMASLVAGKKGQRKKGQIVSVAEAISVDSITGVVADIKLSDKGFVRHIDSEKGLIWRGQSLSLADIVGEGNGFGTGNSNWGINIENGKHAKIDSTKQRLYGDGLYKLSPNPLIDGVFVPDASNGSVQISSTGLIFVECPETSGIANGGDILNGAWHNHIADQPAHLLKLDGRTFEKPGQAIFMCTNKGITFDLDAIRRDNPALKINRFKAIAGVSDTVLEIWNESSRTDFWILVDGQIKVEQIDVKPDDISFNIDIPLTDQDRFLTIITTDSGSEFDFTSRDWALLAQPVLELELE